MLHRVVLASLLALSIVAVAGAAPPPTCSCEVCLPDPELKCKLPQGGSTTCGIFMRSGICLPEGFAPAASDIGAPVTEVRQSAAVPSESTDLADLSQLFPTVLDRLKQNACGCIDLCRSDFECILFHGPGSACVPVGPCGCKECTASS